jgi:hypothetical protein
MKRVRLKKPTKKASIAGWRAFFTDSIGIVFKHQKSRVLKEHI